MRTPSMRPGALPLLLVLALVLAAVPALAESYTVTLTNGTTFLTRYQPEQATWDSSVALILTEVGNWIAIPQADIESVVTDTEIRGYGVRIDQHTLLLGYTANDDPTAEEQAAAAAESGGRGLPPAVEEALTRSYDQKQFVDPGEVGGGIPVGAVPFSSGGGSGLSSSALPSPRSAAPPVSAPSAATTEPTPGLNSNGGS